MGLSRKISISVILAFGFVALSLSGEERFSYCAAGSCSVETRQKMNERYDQPTNLNYTCVRNNQYALTFDDGPGDHWTEILEILERHQIRATFFVVGLNLEQPEHQEMLQRAFADGHQIANHTHSHPYLTELADEKVIEQVKSVRSRIVEILGDKAGKGANYVRPPFGSLDPRVGRLLDEAGFTLVRWNSDRYDWQLGTDDGFVVLERLQQHLDFKEELEPGVNRAILDLNHLGAEATISVLPEMIRMIVVAGYEFVTIQECLKDAS